MQFHKHESKIIICFEKKELQGIFKTQKRQEIDALFEAKGLSLMDLYSADETLKQEIASELSDTTLKNKDEVEVFAALYSFDHFYDVDAEICFYLKAGLDHSNLQISSLVDLIDAVEEYSMTDFIFKINDDFRLIQLKRYRGNLTTNDFFNFIKAKLNHYGRRMGAVNLLIVLQTPKGDLSKVDFKEIGKQISNLNLESVGEILVSYNEENKFEVVNKLYPTLATRRVPIRHS